MKPRWFRPWWLLLLLPLALGLARLRFNVEVLDLLPRNVRAVEGVKLYEQKFSNARELIITVEAPDKELASQTAQAIAEKLRAATNIVTEVTWQPPWLEHPELTTELVAHLWLNQPPEIFRELALRLAETNLPAVLTATREELSTTLSPMEIARLSYDPFGLTRLPEGVSGAAPGLGQGEELFASPDGKFRILFVQARGSLAGYRECTEWVAAVRQITSRAVDATRVKINFTGRPVFVAEISGSMKRDIIVSVVGTSAIIAVLFWIAHRRWKPMLWLLTLLALILASTLALGGLFFGTINVVSMGFAAILLGLAVDYAVVHYQEALAHPDLSVPEIRRVIAPSIFWAAVTTITAFIVLNFGGLPGLAQLGSLVGIGVALSACVMIFAFLPPLFPGRMVARQNPVSSPGFSPMPPAPSDEEPISTVAPARAKLIFAVTTALILVCAAILFSGLPKVDASNAALQPRNSEAFAALTAIKDNLNQKREPLWLVMAGRDEREVARRLDAAQRVLSQAVSNGVLSGFMIPTVLWPQPDHQSSNRATAQQLIARRGTFRGAALAGGFSADALGLTDSLLDIWQRATISTNVFWPTNALSAWIFSKLAARESTNQFAVGFLFPPTNSVNVAEFAKLNSQLPPDGVWLAGWELLGGSVLAVVKQNLWKLVLPMLGLVFLSLWLAFRRLAEIALSLGILLLSGLCLLAVMQLLGWSWNLLNLMALPLILGTGVDYSLFMQLALRRHQGDLRMAHRSVGRALLLCGATAVSGFGSLGLSSNAGMASLGQVCAIGIASNMLISVYLLPVWWRYLVRPSSQSGTSTALAPTAPSSLYGATLWRIGQSVARSLPWPICAAFARLFGALYCQFAPHRRAVVAANLLPVLRGDRPAAARATRKLFQEFALKLAELWRYESGVVIERSSADWQGWEIFQAAYARGKGVLLITPHLGNWEYGGAFLAQRGCKLLVLTQAEPEARLTELRQTSRARWGIETLVVGEDAFAFVEIIKRLQSGARRGPPRGSSPRADRRHGGTVRPAIPRLHRARGIGAGFGLRDHSGLRRSKSRWPRRAHPSRNPLRPCGHRRPRGAHPAHAGNPACIRAGDPATCGTVVPFRAGLAEVKMNIEHPTSNIEHRTKLRSGAGSMLGVRCSMFGVFLFLIFIVPSSAADTNAVLAGWLAAQTNLHTWSADFTQTRTLKALTQPLLATGHIAFAMPNKFRWELGQPAKTIALRNADEMFVIYPRLKRAEHYPIGEKAPGEWRDMLSLLDAGFPRDRAAFDGQFRIVSLTETNRSWVLGLQPASAFARKMMKEIRVGVATNDFSLTSSEMVFIDGSRMRNDYVNPVLNPGFDENVFTWKPEADFKVTEPMAK